MPSLITAQTLIAWFIQKSMVLSSYFDIGAWCAWLALVIFPWSASFSFISSGFKASILNLVWIKMSEKIEKKCNFYPPNHAVTSSIFQFRAGEEVGFELGLTCSKPQGFVLVDFYFM